MFKLNPLLNADSYKFNHINMYPKGVTEVYSNFTPRSVKHLNVPAKYKTNEIVWFGGQAVIKDMVDQWDEYFFKLSDIIIDEEFAGTFASEIDGRPEHSYTNSVKSLDEVLQDFSRIIAPFAGPDYSIKHLKALHALGYLPLEIKTLPEGSRVPVGVPVMTVRNTEPEFFWLTNFIESYLSAELWKMSTSATVADYYRKIGNFWYEKTGANKAFIDFAFHDFSYRGMSNSMDAIKSGAAHLTAFKGSDCVPAVPYLEYHYCGKLTFLAASVPATEHSIQTAFVENDLAYFNSILDAYPTEIVSVVADGYDYWSVLTNVLPQLKPKILARQPGPMGFNKLVIRPDSGDPVRIIAGYTYKDGTDPFYNMHDYEVFKATDGFYYKQEDWDINEYGDAALYSRAKPLTEEEVKGSIQVLWELFGGTTNDKGYKLLDSHIGLIYGDSITLDRAEEILSRLEAKGFAADNVVFGVGSYTYQYSTRDTLGFAMKATNITQNGKDIPLFKDPKTDNGTKKSAKGLLMVDWVTPLSNEKPFLAVFDNQTRENEADGELTTLFKDGEFKKLETIVDIRERLLA
jgi:nicotinamide phosphoribosyltransferase